jgi:hypothetical protein
MLVPSKIYSSSFLTNALFSDYSRDQESKKRERGKKMKSKSKVKNKNQKDELNVLITC